jgi:hypothetical protein
MEPRQTSPFGIPKNSAEVNANSDRKFGRTEVQIPAEVPGHPDVHVHVGIFPCSSQHERMHDIDMDVYKYTLTLTLTLPL